MIAMIGKKLLKGLTDTTRSWAMNILTATMRNTERGFAMNSTKSEMESKAMTEITPAECRELAERLGICWHEKTHRQSENREANRWHCSCGRVFGTPHGLRCHIGSGNKKNPNFLDPVVVLREAMKMEDWPKFFDSLRLTATIYPGELCEDAGEVYYAISVDYILDDTGKLAKALLKWFERKEENNYGPIL